QRQTVRAARAEDQVHMVGHQTVGPDLHLRLAHLFGEQIAIDVLVAVFKEDRLAPGTARRDVMRASRSNNARQASHEAAYHTKNKKGTLLLSPGLLPRAAARSGGWRRRNSAACFIKASRPAVVVSSAVSTTRALTLSA